MTTDPIVVVGSGLAGLTAALAMAPRTCLLLTPGGLTDGSASMLAQGGFAAAITPDDSPALHAEDTWLAGDRAGDRSAIDRIIGAAPDALSRLCDLGVPFDRTPAGELDLHLEAGHRRHRIAHVGDASGAGITTAVAAAVHAAAHIDVREHTRVVSLLTEGRPERVRGLRVQDTEGTHEIAASAVVLATGGYGALYAHATSPGHAVGAGVALAARIGARTDDLHLVQFHPTALDAGHLPGRPMSLLTEAVRGAGAVLLADGERFVDELRPRDQVAAAVWEQLTAGRRVHLDARGVDRVAERFGRVTELCRAVGLDPARDLLPTRPAAHYTMGGVTADARGRSTVPGLWAVGEVSRTGLHGANRLASNSLVEAFVTGRAAAADVLTCPETDGWSDLPVAEVDTVVPARTGPTLSTDQVTTILETGCGVLRDADGITTALHTLEPAIASDDRAYVAWLIARSALAHPSRGAHRRTNDATLTHTISTGQEVAV